MADYPDWTRLFHLVGTDITIPISIEASDVTIPVSIDAVTVAIDVNIAAAAVTLPISIDAATVTLDVNLTAATATIDINFADQSVAVFDAAKWFAHMAAQWSVLGNKDIAPTSYDTVASRTVPAGKTAFIVGIGWGPNVAYDIASIPMFLNIAGTAVARGGSYRGDTVIFDVPFRATTGQIIRLDIYNLDTSGRSLGGVMWGWDE